jgi:Flp pilus assembly protein TadD
MAESVVCTFCGAKIKEGRTRCLRCGEALVPAAVDTQAPGGLDEFVGRHRGRLTIAGSVVSVAALLVMAMNLRTAAPLVPENAGIGGPQFRQRPTAAASPSAPAVEAAPKGFQPVTSLDAQRVGNAAYAQGDFQGALESYELALKKNPNDAAALNNLGQALVRVGRAKEALSHFERAAALSPSEWAPRFNLAHAYGELGDWPHAIPEYEHAAQLFPDDYVTHYNLGMALHKASREEPAVAEFKRAIALAPGEPSFRLSLAMSYERLQKPAEAAAAYEEYLELAPSPAEAAKVKTRIEALRHPAAPPPQG